METIREFDANQVKKRERFLSERALHESLEEIPKHIYQHKGYASVTIESTEDLKKLMELVAPLPLFVHRGGFIHFVAHDADEVDTDVISETGEYCPFWLEVSGASWGDKLIFWAQVRDTGELIKISCRLAFNVRSVAHGHSCAPGRPKTYVHRLERLGHALYEGEGMHDEDEELFGEVGKAYRMFTTEPDSAPRPYRLCFYDINDKMDLDRLLWWLS